MLPKRVKATSETLRSKNIHHLKQQIAAEVQLGTTLPPPNPTHEKSQTIAMVLRYKPPKNQAADYSMATSSSTLNHHDMDKPTSNQVCGDSAYHSTYWPTYLPTCRPAYLLAFALISKYSKIVWQHSKKRRYVPNRTLNSTPKQHSPVGPPDDPSPTALAVLHRNNNSSSNTAKQIRTHIHAPGMEKAHLGKSTPKRKGQGTEYW